MSEDGEQLGPIDYILVEWSGRQPNGEVAPHLVDLVDRGLIRVLDLVFMRKQESGEVEIVEISDLGEADETLLVFEGAATGLLDQDDLDEAGAVLAPGTAAALLVFENRWAAPFATAVRKSGGELVASGRIPVNALIAALDAVEAGDRRRSEDVGTGQRSRKDRGGGGYGNRRQQPGVEAPGRALG